MGGTCWRCARGDRVVAFKLAGGVVVGLPESFDEAIGITPDRIQIRFADILAHR